MPKTPKVVSIQKETSNAKFIAHDPEGHRIIIGIGRQRMAMDFHTRFTRLPPETGDQPAEVVPMTSPTRNRLSAPVDLRVDVGSTGSK
jgi:hypothetical protein